MFPSRGTRMKTWSKRSAIAVASVLCLSAVAASPALAGPTPATENGVYAFGVNFGDEGYIKQGGYIYNYAMGVVDPDGIQHVTVDISQVAASGTAYDSNNVFLRNYDPDFYAPVGGIRTKSTLAEGTYPWSATVTDKDGDTTTFNRSVIVDNTKPVAFDVQTANGGAVVGKAEQGDTVTITFTENQGMGQRPAGDTPNNMVARIDNMGSNDVLKLYIETNNREDYYFGQVKLGRDYVSSNRQFGATGTKSTVVRSGNSYVLTLGTPSGSTNTVSSSSTMSWTVGAFPPNDKSGNPANRITVSEKGAADREF